MSEVKKSPFDNHLRHMRVEHLNATADFMQLAFAELQDKLAAVEAENELLRFALSKHTAEPIVFTTGGIAAKKQTNECVWPEPDLNNAALQTGCGGKSMFVTPYCMCCGGKVTIAAAKEESK